MKRQMLALAASAAIAAATLTVTASQASIEFLGAGHLGAENGLCLVVRTQDPRPGTIVYSTPCNHLPKGQDQWAMWQYAYASDETIQDVPGGWLADPPKGHYGEPLILIQYIGSAPENSDVTTNVCLGYNGILVYLENCNPTKFSWIFDKNDQALYGFHTGYPPAKRNKQGQWNEPQALTTFGGGSGLVFMLPFADTRPQKWRIAG